MSDQIIIDITPAPVEPVIVNIGQSPVISVNISVNGRCGAVTLTKEDVGLGNVINTSDYLPLSGGLVTGTISANNTIYDNVGNSTQWNKAYNVATTYQSASGNWQSTYSVFSQTSAFSIVAGGNTRNANITIGTNDAYHLRLETNNTARFTVLSSGDIGVGTTLAETAAAGAGGLIIKNNLLVGRTTVVTGTISANNTIYDNVGNSTQWNKAYNVATTYQSASGSFATNTLLQSTSALLTPLTLTNTLSSQLVLNTDFDSYKTNVASATATLLPIAGGTLTGNLTVNGTVSASSTIFSGSRRAVTTNTTTVPGTSAVTSILAVSALPVVQETGVLYIVI